MPNDWNELDRNYMPDYGLRIDALTTDVAFLTFDCQICNEVVKSGLAIVVPLCKHRFHNSCFTRHFAPCSKASAQRSVASASVPDDSAKSQETGLGHHSQGSVAVDGTTTSTEAAASAVLGPNMASDISADTSTEDTAEAQQLDWLRPLLCPKCGTPLNNDPDSRLPSRCVKRRRVS